MAIRMTRPTQRSDSSLHQFRQRLPKGMEHGAGTKLVIRFPAAGGDAEHTVNASIGRSEVKFSLNTRDPEVAKERTGIANAHLSKLYASLRKAGPINLPWKQCVALTSQWYSEFVATHEDDPEPKLKHLRDALSYYSDMDRLVIEEDENTGKKHYDVGVIHLIRKEVLRPHAIGQEPDAETWDRLVRAMSQTIRNGLATVIRYGEGDYSPDTVPATFPAVDWSKIDIPQPEMVIKEAKAKPLRFDDLLSQWWEDVSRKTDKTVKTRLAYEKAWKALGVYMKHDNAARITKANIEAFRDARIDDGKSPATINQQLDGLKSVCAWAVKKGLLTANPVEGVERPSMRKGQTQDRGFTEDEAKAILMAANAVRIPCKTKLNAKEVKNALARRWVPWLMAYTGARVGEMTQLRKQDIKQDNQGGWYLTVTPEAGTVKTKQYRDIPIHDHMIEMGLIAFVESQPDGYLFLDAPLSLVNDPEVMEITIFKANQMLARTSRIHANGKQSNHAWRHRFKTIGRDVDIPEHTLDALCGHTPSSVGAGYGVVSLRKKREAIQKLPKYEV